MISEDIVYNGIGNLIVRADAFSKIGTGHIMRCLALAQAWKKRGGTVTFLSYCESDTLHHRIIDEGFSFISVENPHPDPSDLQTTLNILEELKKQKSTIDNRQSSIPGLWLVIDGYHFDTSYQKAIKEADYRLLVIDDMAHLPYYYADTLLNQNINAEKLSYQCDSNTKLLLGTHYALLRQEFLSWRGWKRKIPDVAHKILVTLGGADSNNGTFKVVKALNIINDRDIQVKIVIGPSNPNIEILKMELSNSPFTYNLLHSVKDMPKLMAWADVAISGGGSTCWEMAYLGLPNIIIELADNQKMVAVELDREGCSLNLGFYENIVIKDLSKQLMSIIRDQNQRKLMSERGRKIIDGLGSERVLGELTQLVSTKPKNSNSKEFTIKKSTASGGYIKS